MAEEPQELKLPTPTTKDVLPKKPRKPRPRKSMREDVYEPRIWVWALTICVILQLVGFVTCKPPSRGYYYRQRLSSSLSKSIKLAQARLSTLTNTAVQIASKNIQDNLLPWISHQWRVFRDDGSKIKDAPESPPWQARGYFEDFSSSIVSLRESISVRWEWLAMLVLATLIGVLAFSKLSKRERQSSSASLAQTTLIKKPGAQGNRVEPALQTSIDKAMVPDTRIWPVGKIFLGTAVLGLLMLYLLNCVDVERFWEWGNGVPLVSIRSLYL